MGCSNKYVRSHFRYRLYSWGTAWPVGRHLSQGDCGSHFCNVRENWIQKLRANEEFGIQNWLLVSVDFFIRRRKQATETDPYLTDLIKVMDEEGNRLLEEYVEYRPFATGREGYLHLPQATGAISAVSVALALFSQVDISDWSCCTLAVPEVACVASDYFSTRPHAW